MKNKGLIITLVVILSAIAIALIMFFVVLLSNKVNFKKINFGYKTSTNLILNDSYDENFRLVNIKATMGDVYIKKSEDNTTKVEIYGNQEDLETSVDDSTLSISYKTKGCFGICINQQVAKITVYLPQDYNQKIAIEDDYGDVIVNDFLSAEISITEDCGDIKIGNIKQADIQNNYGDVEINEVTIANIKVDCGDININKVADLTIENSYGNTEIENVTNYINMKADCGDIKINNLGINKNSFIENKYGDIEIEQTNNIYIESSVNLGDNNINKNNRKSEITLKIDADCGDVDVN